MTPEHWVAVRARAPTVERAYFSEEDRRRLVVIEQMLRGEADGLPAQTFAKVSAGFDNVPHVWLQRLFFRLNPWTGKPRARGERAPSEIRAREEGKDGR